jgi:putative flippase GtrA
MTALIKNPAERTRFFKFALVGTLGAVVDFGVFNILSSILRVSPVPASVISFCAAVSSNFLWNRYWTYPDSRSKPVGKQIVQFTLVNVAGLAIRTPLFAILEPILGQEFRLLHAEKFGLAPEFLGHNLALAIAVGTVMLWNFFANRYWTYNDINNDTDDDDDEDL